MSTVVTSGARSAIAASWAERNQEWLTARLAHWRERLIEPVDDRPRRQVALTPIGSGEDSDVAADRLARLFGLSAFEAELLVLAAGVEIDSALRDAVAAAEQMRPGTPVRLRFSLALGLVPQSHWDALSPLGPLRHWSLAVFDTSDGFESARVRVDERILHYLTGVAACDERLAGVAWFDDEPADPGMASIASAIAARMTSVRRPAAILANTTGPGRLRSGHAAARGAFARLGLRTLCVDAAALGTDAREIDAIARLLDREAALSGAAICLTADADISQTGSAARLARALRTPVVMIGSPGSADVLGLAGRTTLRFTLPVPETPMEAVPEEARAAASRALQQFRVEPQVVEQALAAVIGLTDPAALERGLWDALRESARGGLDQLAQRIDSRATFDDLVVPPYVAGQLREIAGQLRHRQQVYGDWGFGERHTRGLGIAALFAGESGTGKTLAAEAIANEARLDLYRIDLSGVVSKYIGDTEKNLAKVFDAAERSGAVLLFDEADALFGRRSEVKDSHDRYANIEIAYLLQRIETYRGLAILTTNLKSALDRAFLRRIRFVVQFPFPDRAARAEIWRRVFPPRAPLEGIDADELARLTLSGGGIRAVAINAAFAAAARGGAIDQQRVMEAARAELAKMERTLGEAARGGRG